MRSKIGALLALLLLAACDQYGGSRYISDYQEYSFNGVKPICEFERSSYANVESRAEHLLDVSRRLLLRLEDFGNHTTTVVVDSKAKVLVQVTMLDDEDQEAARASLRLCPLTRDWMMLATWDRRHPFSDDGRWQTPGGDFDRCLPALPGMPENSSGALAVSDVREDRAPRKLSPIVRFDVTEWFKNFPRGRGANYGFVLKSDLEVRIHGETSGQFSPRIVFRKFEGMVLRWPTPEPNVGPAAPAAGR